MVLLAHPGGFEILPAVSSVSPRISSVQSLSHVWLFVTPWIAARQASLSITNSQNLLKLISPSNEHQGLVYFRMDWLDLLAVQGTLKSLLQHHSSKPSILWRSVFFTVQLSLPYMITGKTIALTRWTYVGKVISLFFNMLSRLVITFLPRSKHLLISWLQSPSAVILEPPPKESLTLFPLFPHLFPMKWWDWMPWS